MPASRVRSRLPSSARASGPEETIVSTQPEVVRLTQQADYRFECDFGPGKPAWQLDEPPPLGQGVGPSPTQLLAASVGNCLSASLLFALRKFKQQPEPISCEARPEVGRNDQGRLRVLGIAVTLRLGRPAAQLQHLDRVLASFEAFCTVTQSIHAAIPVTVQVLDAEGVQLK
jgi:uncharacterized OsmC-like protein